MQAGVGGQLRVQHGSGYGELLQEELQPVAAVASAQRETRVLGTAQQLNGQHDETESDACDVDLPSQQMHTARVANTPFDIVHEENGFA